MITDKVLENQAQSRRLREHEYNVDKVELTITIFRIAELTQAF